MRKGFTSSVFILLLVVFSGAVLAGDKSECDKYGKKKLQELGVYGLCVAYYNADESARQGIADKFKEQAGFEVPGVSTQDFDCPCWAELSFADVCHMGVAVRPTFMMVSDKIVFANVRFAHDFGTEKFSYVEAHCSHSSNDLKGYLTSSPDKIGVALYEGELLDCTSEIVEISTMYDTEFCQTEAP